MKQTELTDVQISTWLLVATCVLILMVAAIIFIVLYFNYKNRKYAGELEQLRAKHQQEIKQAKGNTEDEYLMISGGRKVKNKNWKGNTLKDSHIMD